MKNIGAAYEVITAPAKQLVNKPNCIKKNFSLNPTLKKNLEEAFNVLKFEAQSSNIKDFTKVIKSLEDIFEGNTSVSTSYKALEKDNIIPRFAFNIEDAFYTIGLELHASSTGSSSNLLREVYKADTAVLQQDSRSFNNYQQATIEEVHHLLEAQLIGIENSSTLKQ